MNHSDLSIENFLAWFGRLPEIPLQTRYNFMQHVMQTGKLDQKSLDFIQETLQKLIAKSEQRQAEWAKYQGMIEASVALEKNPKTSLKHKIATQINTWVEDKVLQFKQLFKADQVKQDQRAESVEQGQAESEVANIKASLGLA